MVRSKHILSILLVIIVINSFSQDAGYIAGKVLGKNNEPVEFATLYNLTKNKGCITNFNGDFTLVAEPGDSIRIQHLNYRSKLVKIKNQTPTFILTEKEFLINEVTVSPEAAFQLFNTACKNTWQSFKSENITRAFCHVARTNGPNISQQIDLDLDIAQKKQRNFKRGEKILPYKIQERVVTDTSIFLPNFRLTLNIFYPLIHEIYWVDLPENFNYFKVEDEETIKLYLLSKNTFDQNCRIEVVIEKADSLLKTFAMVKKDLYTTVKLAQDIDTIHIQKTEHFIEYDYSSGFGVLDQFYQSIMVKDPSDKNNSIAITQRLQNKNKGELQLTKRRGRRRIFRNTFDPVLVINRYEQEFWLAQNYDEIPYDFIGLSNLEMYETKQKIVVQNEKPETEEKNVSPDKITWIKYELDNKEETILSIAQKQSVTTDDLYFYPYYLKLGKPIFAEKKYTLQDMIPLAENTDELVNQILQVYYSNEPLIKTKSGCTNFTCSPSMICVVFPFPDTAEDILVDGFEIYVRKNGDE